MIFNPNTSVLVRTAIQQKFNIHVVQDFEKYLGLLARIGHSKWKFLITLKTDCGPKCRGGRETVAESED